MAKVICKVTNPQLQALLSREIKVTLPQWEEKAAELRQQAFELMTRAKRLEDQIERTKKCEANNSHEMECDDSSPGSYEEECIHCGWIHRV
jgi:hypothetical protein